MKRVCVGNYYAISLFMRIAIIGNGIAAWCINKYLSEEDSKLDIDRFGDDSFIRTCSLRTTSINCMRGTKKGISPLGDLIFDSMKEFESYYERFHPSGVLKTSEYQLWEEGDERIEKRFDSFDTLEKINSINLIKKMRFFKSDAYLINPIELYKSFKLNPIKDKFVSSLRSTQDGYILNANGKSYTYDLVILACSNMNKLFIDLIENNDAIDYLKRSKPVKGDYLYLKKEHDYSPLSLAIKNKHLIFRENEILIGSTSFNDNAIEAIHERELKETYDFVKSYVDLKLPSYDDFDKVTGIRNKGRKRMPYWGEVGPNLFMIGGLYKNGFSFSFLAAKELSKEILKI